MAEALAAIALAGNIVQLTEFSILLFSRVKSFLSKSAVLPPTLHNLSLTLPLLQSSTISLQRRAQQHAFDQGTQHALLVVLGGLEGEVQSLNDLMLGLLPKDGENKLVKSLKAFQSMRAGKEVEDRRQRIDTLVTSLNVFLGMRNSEGIDVLVEAAGAKKRDQIEEKPRLLERRKRIWMVDYEREQDFVGRDVLMKQIQARFDVGARRVAVVGIGGVGKSRIAIEHSHDQQQNRQDVDIFWVHGGSRSNFEEAYRRIARLRDTPGREDKDIDILRLVRDHLEENVDPWLMILDNADNRDDWLQSDGTSANARRPLVEYLPRCDHGSILITTRDTQLGLRLTGGKHEPLQVGRFGPEDAGQLLRAKVAEGHAIEDKDVNELATALEHLPLTITQAAAYLSQIDMSVTEYLAAFRAGLSDIPELLTESIDDPSRDRGTSNSVFQAWRLSFDQISKQSPRAAEVLSLMSMLDRQEIPQALLKKKEESPIQFKAAMAKLKAFSFVTEDKQTGRYSMHRLVQLSTQRWIQLLERTHHFSDMAIVMIAQSCPTDADFQYWPIFIELQPHVDIALEYTVESKETLLRRATILNMFGRYSLGRGQIENALKLLEEARQLREEHLGQKHEDTLSATGQCGVAYGMLGKTNLSQAHRIQEEVLAVSLTTLGPTHPLTLKTQSRIAVNHSKFNDFQKAKLLHLQVLTKMQVHLGASHKYTLSELSHLLYTLNRLHHWNEALEVGTLALKLRTEVLGPCHPDTATIMSQLSMTYSALKRFDETVDLEEKVLDLRMKALGPEHPKTLLAMENLSRTFAKQGKLNEAEDLLSWVVDTRSKTLNHDNYTFIRAKKALTKLRQLVKAKERGGNNEADQTTQPGGEKKPLAGENNEEITTTSSNTKKLDQPRVDEPTALERAFKGFDVNSAGNNNSNIADNDDVEDDPPPPAYSELAS